MTPSAVGPSTGALTEIQPLSRLPGWLVGPHHPSSPAVGPAKPGGDPPWAPESRRRTLTPAHVFSLGLQVSLVFGLFCLVLCFACRPTIFARVGPDPLVGQAPPVAMGFTGGGESVPAADVVEDVVGPAPTSAPARQPTVAAPLAVDEPAVPQATVQPTASSAAALVQEPRTELAALAARQPADASPTRIQIPRIGLDVPVRPIGTKVVHNEGKEELIWDTWPDVAGFHETSAYPGHPGNTVINGHRDVGAAVFRDLGAVQVGDEIDLFVGDQVYVYRVDEVLVVPHTYASPEQHAENRRLIGPLPEERLTLITCTPIGSATHRLLVIARPVSEPRVDDP